MPPKFPGVGFKLKIKCFYLLYHKSKKLLSDKKNWNWILHSSIYHIPTSRGAKFASINPIHRIVVRNL